MADGYKAKDMESEFHRMTWHKFLKNQTDKRVSQAAAEEIGEFMDDWTSEIAEKAWNLAQLEGYTETVKQRHVKKALEDKIQTDHNWKLEI